MLNRQREIAAEAVANIVERACMRLPSDKTPRPTADELKKLAEDAGAAIAAGISKIKISAG